MPPLHETQNTVAPPLSASTRHATVFAVSDKAVLEGESAGRLRTWSTPGALRLARVTTTPALHAKGGALHGVESPASHEVVATPKAQAPQAPVASFVEVEIVKAEATGAARDSGKPDKRRPGALKMCVERETPVRV